MILIKLGGSVITDKERPYSFKRRITQKLIDEIKSSSEEEFIIVHGGGSFGHPGAEKFSLNSKSPENMSEGTSKVQKDMRVLNNRIIDMFLDQDMWAVSIPGGIVTRFKNGELVGFDSEIFDEYLDIGTIPVTFGDVALDSERGVTICSGDDLMYILADKAEKAIFASNVDGVFKDGELVETFTSDMLPLSPEDVPNRTGSIDVTGGMNSKVEKMLDISEKCPTYVVNGERKGRLGKLIDGEETVCTEVKR